MAWNAVTEQPSQIGIVKLVDILSMSFALGHDDVLCNMRSGFSCSECRRFEADLTKLRRCDGVFPSNAGLGYPAGGDGRQFACNRGLICDECAKDLPQRSKYWLCPRCKSGPRSVGDAWGYDIEEPTFLRPPGVQSMFSTPKPSYWCDASVHPADEWIRKHERHAVATAPEVQGCRRRRTTEEDKSIFACSEFLRLARNAGFPRREMDKVLHILHELH